MYSFMVYFIVILIVYLYLYIEKDVFYGKRND